MKCPMTLLTLTNLSPFPQYSEIVLSFTFHCLENKKWSLQEIIVPQIHIFMGTKIKHIATLGGHISPAHCETSIKPFITSLALGPEDR